MADLPAVGEAVPFPFKAADIDEHVRRIVAKLDADAQVFVREFAMVLDLTGKPSHT
jgi:hypothetical protein